MGKTGKMRETGNMGKQEKYTCSGHYVGSYMAY